MTDENILQDSVEIILDRILTPIIYLYADEVFEFICFPNSNISDEDFKEAEESLYLNLGIKAEIIDIRNFTESERLEITKSAQLLYAEDEIIKMLFETATAADNERSIKYKKELLLRKKDTGSYYIN